MAHVNSPPSAVSVLWSKRTYWYMSDHYTFVYNHTFCSCLQFSVCVDFHEIENLLGISFEENFANNCFRFSFSLTKSLATSTTYYCCGCRDISCNCLHMRMRGFVLLKSFLFLHCIFQLENRCFVKARSALD